MGSIYFRDRFDGVDSKYPHWFHNVSGILLIIGLMLSLISKLIAPLMGRNFKLSRFLNPCLLKPFKIESPIITTFFRCLSSVSFISFYFSSFPLPFSVTAFVVLFSYFSCSFTWIFVRTVVSLWSRVCTWFFQFFVVDILCFLCYLLFALVIVFFPVPRGGSFLAMTGFVYERARPTN